MMPAETVVTGLVRESPARRPAGREILALSSGGSGDGGKRCVAAALAACRAGSGSNVELWFTGSAEAQATTDRFIVTVDKTADFAAARAALLGSGAEIITEIPELNLLVVQRGAAAAATMAAVPGVSGTIPDRITRISPPEGREAESRCTRTALGPPGANVGSAVGHERHQAGSGLRL